MADIQKIRGCIRKSINKLIDGKILEADKSDFKIRVKEYTEGSPIVEIQMPRYFDTPLSFGELPLNKLGGFKVKS